MLGGSSIGVRRDVTPANSLTLTYERSVQSVRLADGGDRREPNRPRPRDGFPDVASRYECVNLECLEFGIVKTMSQHA